MTPSEHDSSPMREAYDSLAPIYDDFRHQNNHEMWIGKLILAELEALGLEGPGAALDIGCGTGMGFPPLLDRGWSVHGCDLSPGMLAAAAERFGDRVKTDVADMRDLPRFGSFDLILALNDPINHLLGDGDLEPTMRGIAKNLAPGGLAVFDCNTEAAFVDDDGPAARQVVEQGGRTWVWQGLGASEDSPSIFQFQVTGDDVGSVKVAERLWTLPEIGSAVEAAGLRTRRVLGQSETTDRIILSDGVDETRDYKVIHVVSHA